MENEIELIKGCKAGDNVARKKLYTLYSNKMLAVCYRYTGDMDAAHDVLHDAFIKYLPGLISGVKHRLVHGLPELWSLNHSII